MDDTGYLQVRITLKGFLQSGRVVQKHVCERDERSAPAYAKCGCMNGGFFGPNRLGSLASFTAWPQKQLRWPGAAAGRYCLSHTLCTAAAEEDVCGHSSL